MIGKHINVPKLLILEGYVKTIEEAKQLIASGMVAFDGHIFKGTYLIMQILEKN